VPRPFILPCFARECVLPPRLLRAALFCTIADESTIVPHVILVTKSTRDLQRR
jgi:hypothetical protein